MTLKKETVRKTPAKKPAAKKQADPKVSIDARGYKRRKVVGKAPPLKSLLISADNADEKQLPLSHYTPIVRVLMSKGYSSVHISDWLFDHNVGPHSSTSIRKLMDVLKKEQGDIIENRGS